MRNRVRMIHKASIAMGPGRLSERTRNAIRSVLSGERLSAYVGMATCIRIIDANPFNKRGYSVSHIEYEDAVLLGTWCDYKDPAKVARALEYDRM